MDQFPFEIEIKRAGLEAFYPLDAYILVRDALVKTQNLIASGQIGEQKSGDLDSPAPSTSASSQDSDHSSRVGHVTGRELLEGFRLHVLKEYGPMAHYVLQEWKIFRCEDVGEIVYRLIEAGIFGKSKEDQIEDFASIYDFEEAFLKPYRTHHEDLFHGEKKSRSVRKSSRSAKVRI